MNNHSPPIEQSSTTPTPKRKSTTNILILLFQTLLGFAILGYLIYQIGAEQILATISAIPLLVWSLLLVYTFLSVFITSLCYKSLIDPTCGKITPKEIFKYSLTTASLSRSFLGRYAEVTLIYFLKKRGVEYGRGISIFLVDKIITLITQLIISIIGVIFFFPSKPLLYAFIGLLIITGLSLLTLQSKPIKQFIKEKILRKYQSKFKQFSSTFHDLYYKHKSALILNTLFTLLRLILTGIAVYGVFHYLGSDVPLLETIIINTILMTASLIPLTANGIGIRETLGVYLFGLYGVDPVVTVSAYLLFRITNYLFGILLLPHNIILYFKTRKESIKKGTKETQ